MIFPPMPGRARQPTTKYAEHFWRWRNLHLPRRIAKETMKLYTTEAHVDEVHP